MIIPELKDCYSTDRDEIWKWNPQTNADIKVDLSLDIGSIGEKGADLFQVVIISPEAMTLRWENDQCYWGRHYIIVKEWNWNRIYKFINDKVVSCSAPTWEEVAGKLSRHFAWEYEDCIMLDDPDHEGLQEV